MKSVYVKICPKCKNLNIRVSHQGSLSGLTALGLPTVYVCRKCGFTSNVFPEIDILELDKTRSKTKSKETIKKNGRKS